MLCDCGAPVRGPVCQRGHRVVLTEAKAAGSEHSKWDDMDSDTLRNHIAKYKAMGDKGPAVPMLRATQALARKLAVREDWAAWDAEHKHGKFVGMKAGPFISSTPSPEHQKDSPGRGPTGKLRNFHAMSDAKLHATIQALIVHGEDEKAMQAAHDELASRGGSAPVVKASAPVKVKQMEVF